jgi:2-phospho-L-lactate guanylyltransferase
VLIVHSDLPNATDLASLDDHSAAVIVVPDRHHDGTNALLVPSDGAFEFCYGPGSFDAHCAQAKKLGLSLRVVHRPDLALDLDTLDDLRAAGL